MSTPEWLQSPDQLPKGGDELLVTYRTGSRSSKRHLRELGSTLKSVFGTDPFPGSLNLWADSPIAFKSPAAVTVGRSRWLLAPVVIGERAVGVAARKPPPTETEFIEVFASEELVPKLRLQPNGRVAIRILDGSHLGLSNREDR